MKMVFNCRIRNKILKNCKWNKNPECIIFLCWRKFYPYVTKNCDTEFDMFIEVNRKAFVKLYNSLIGGMVQWKTPSSEVTTKQPDDSFNSVANFHDTHSYIYNHH